MQIPRDDLNDARRDLTNISRMNKNLQEALSKAEKKRRKDQKASAAKLEERSAAFQNSVQSLKSSMKDMEQRQVDAMQEQSREFQTQIQAQANRFDQRLAKEQSTRRQEIMDLAKWTQQGLEQQQKEFELIAERQQKQILANREQITSMLQKQVHNREAA
ncbi:MAG: hypothetical protein AAF696_37565, partial [Bacteroidota bacterium]